jgi:hypothetical protein
MEGERGAKGRCEGKGEGSSGGQEANVIQWVNTSDHMKEFTRVNAPKGKKETDADTPASLPAILTSGMSGPGSSATTPLNPTTGELSLSIGGLTC